MQEVIKCKKSLDAFMLPIEFRLEARETSFFIVCSRVDLDNGLQPHNISSKVFFSTRPSSSPKNIMEISLKRMLEQLSLPKDFSRVVDFQASKVSFDDYEKLPHAQKIGVDARLIRRELCSMLIPVISELIEATFDFIKEISDLNMETLTVFKLSKNGWEKT